MLRFIKHLFTSLWRKAAPPREPSNIGPRPSETAAEAAPRTTRPEPLLRRVEKAPPTRLRLDERTAEITEIPEPPPPLASAPEPAAETTPTPGPAPTSAPPPAERGAKPETAPEPPPPAPTPPAPPAPPATPRQEATLEAFIARQGARDAELMTRLAGLPDEAGDGEEARLIDAMRDEVGRRLAAPERAFSRRRAELSAARRALDALIDPTSAEAGVARDDLDAGDATAAIAALRARAASESDNARDRLDRAAAAYQAGVLAYGEPDFAAAAQDFDLAASLDPAKPGHALAAARLARELGRDATAIDYFKTAVESFEKTLGGDAREVADTLVELAEAAADADNIETATQALDRAGAVWSRSGSEPGLAAARAIDGVAARRQARGDHEAADALYAHAIGVMETVWGADHIELAAPLHNHAETMRALGQTEGAEASFRRALSIKEAALGSAHPSVAATLAGLGTLLTDAERFAGAEGFLTRAVAILEETDGEAADHDARLAAALNGLAAVRRAEGDYERARPLMTRALSLMETGLGPRHPDVATALNNIAVVDYSQGRLGDAEPALRRALDIREEALGPDNPETRQAVENLSTLLFELGKAGEVDQLFRRFGYEGVEAEEIEDDEIDSITVDSLDLSTSDRI